MSVKRYPDFMPRPLQNSFTVKGIDRRFASATSAGKTIVAQYKQPEYEVSCKVLLSSEQAAWFDFFVNETLKGGTLPFEFPILLAGEIQWRAVWLAKMPEASDVDSYHVTYTLSLKVR